MLAVKLLLLVLILCYFKRVREEDLITDQITSCFVFSVQPGVELGVYCVNGGSVKQSQSGLREDDGILFTLMTRGTTSHHDLDEMMVCLRRGQTTEKETDLFNRISSLFCFKPIGSR